MRDASALITDPTPRPCPHGSLVAYHDLAARVVPSFCQRWVCVRCGPWKARVLAERIGQTPANRLITFTTRYLPGGNPVAELDLQNRAWRLIWKRIKRRQGPRAKGYVKVIELTKNGWPHLHVAVDCGYVEQKQLSSWWRELTGSPVVDIRAIHSTRSLSKYLAKYLTKSMDGLPGRRRYSATWRWLPARTETPLEPDEIPPEWSYLPADHALVEAMYESGGFIFFEGWWLSPDARPPAT